MSNNQSYKPRAIYVPALIDGMANVCKACIDPTKKFGLYKDKHDPSWFSDMAIFIHEHILTSFHYSRKYKNFKKDLRFRDDITLWADSGGYSVATKGVKITPKEALDWQEICSDIAFSLDIPPTIVTAGNQISPGKNERVTMDVFEQHAEWSRKNNLYFRDNRKREDLLIYNVQHGYDIDTFDLWWDYTARDIQFEGYATGPKPSGDILLQAMSIMYLWDKGVTERVHLLGVSGITVIPALVWASQYIDKISFDSTSYGYGSMTRAYVFPDRIRYYTHFGEKYLQKVGKNKIMNLTCTCPICIDFDTPEYFCGSGSTWPGLLLSLHNLWAVKQYVEKLDRAINVEKDVDKFMKLVYENTGTTANKTIHAINFIEDCIKYGFKKSYDIYFANHVFNTEKRKHRKII